MIVKKTHKKPPHWQAEAISFFVKEAVWDTEEFPWKNQVQIVNRLFKKYPDKNFWLKLDLGFKLNNCAFFLTPNGKEELNKHWNLFNLKVDSKQEVLILGDKVGEDFSGKKIKTLKEFLES
jgi:hypothetical protein